MLTELYIEALLADEALADQVWMLWDAGVITDELAAWAWSSFQDSRVQKSSPAPQFIERHRRSVI